MGEIERNWEDLGEFGKNWEDLKRYWEDLGGFEKILDGGIGFIYCLILSLFRKYLFCFLK